MCKENFTKLTINNKINILPDWHFKDNINDSNVYIRPGMSFGTGHHETTSLMIESLIDYSNNEFSLLDLGAGSGILSIVGSKLKYKDIKAVEFDIECKHDFYFNTELNSCSKDIEIFWSDVLDWYDFSNDLILANIEKNIIKKMIKNIENTNEVFRGGSAYEKITIETPLYSADFSNFGGGAFETYELKQFSGSWKDDSYVDTMRVSLLTNNSNVCAPCIGPEDAPLKINFNCSSSLGWKNNQAVVLDADDDLSIVCAHVDTEGNRYTKTTIFSADSYSINHDIIASSPNEKMVFYWDVGLLNTEKNIFDENTYSGISISNNKEIETVSFSPGNIGDKLESSSFDGNIDWVAIRNKYFVLAIIPDASVGITTGSLLGGSALELNKNNFYPVFCWIF